MKSFRLATIGLLICFGLTIGTQVAEARYPHPSVSRYARMRSMSPAPYSYTYGPRPRSFSWGYFGASRHTQVVPHESYHRNDVQWQFRLGY